MTSQFVSEEKLRVLKALSKETPDIVGSLVLQQIHVVGKASVENLRLNLGLIEEQGATVTYSELKKVNESEFTNVKIEATFAMIENVALWLNGATTAV